MHRKDSTVLLTTELSLSHKLRIGPEVIAVNDHGDELAFLLEKNIVGTRSTLRTKRGGVKLTSVFMATSTKVLRDGPSGFIP